MGPDERRFSWRGEIRDKAPQLACLLSVRVLEGKKALFAREQRYVHAVRSQLMVSNSFRYFGYNGRFVVMKIWGSLHAYDPDTGELAWKIGD